MDSFNSFNQLRRAHMPQKIVFKSKGLNCSGLFYLPDNYSATDDVKLPAIAMAHGMGIPKEVGLPQFAARFADAGFAVLIFDFRNLGESEGTPRGQIFAEDQQEDYRNAITWLQLQSQMTRNGSASGASLSLGATCFRLPPSTAALNVSLHRFLQLAASLQRSGSTPHQISMEWG
jgi:dipeptidyl aminopeptidase/acylaminoacyl peptidase